MITASQYGWGVTASAVVVPAIDTRFSVTLDYGNGYSFNIAGSYDGTTLTINNKYGTNENEFQITIIGLIY